MNIEIKNAFKELVAAIGGEENIILFGKKKSDKQTLITIQLKRNDVVHFDAFVFFEGVYCLEQSQGICLAYKNSKEMNSFFLFLKSEYPDKFYGLRSEKLKRLKEIPFEFKREPVKKLDRKRNVDRKDFTDF